MKHLGYIRMEELLKEADYTPDTEATDARKRANTSDAAQSGKKPKMGGDFSDSPRRGEVRVPEVGVTLPKAKAKKVPLMRRMGRLVAKWATRAGRHMDPFQ